jgi:hypothetical protein
MTARNAWFWAFTAAILFLAVVGYERFVYRPPAGPLPLLPGLVAAQVDAIQVRPPDAPEIRVERTNGTWRLTRPLSYPGQANSIEALLESLEQIVPATTITGTELKSGTETGGSYGLETPRASLVLSAGGVRQQLLIGSPTAPGDQVFVQVVGSEGVSVIDSELLKLIPVSANMWRDTELFDLEDGIYDSISVTSGGGVLELTRDAADRTWQIIRPMQARADGMLVGQLVQGLRDLQVKEFVSDDPRVDRQTWGLQPPQVEIVFSSGTNVLRTLQFGTPVDGATNALYAVGPDGIAVVVAAADPIQGWQATPNDFRDPQLLKVPREVTSIEVSNGEAFSLVNSTNGIWRIEPLGIPADPDTVRRFLLDLQGLRVLRFVKDVVAEPDLPDYGLATPSFTVLLRADPETASQPARVIGLEFGAQHEDSVFVRRVDENAVYALGLTSLESIPAAAGHFRDLNLWKFNEDQVAALVVRKGDASWRLTRNGLNQWSLAEGSQGIVNPFGVEEAVHRLGELRAVVWTDWQQEAEARYGLDEDSVAITVELKDGSRKSLRFGFPSPAGHIYCGTMLEGASWVFEFPGDTFDLVQSFLIKPSNLP